MPSLLSLLPQTPPLSKRSPVRAAVTAAASLLSLIGSGFILVCYAILPLNHHFRHILILNLATSGTRPLTHSSYQHKAKKAIDFLNSLNNSVGGLYILALKKPLKPGLACVFDGYVAQVTVLATDCAILVIAITTVYTIIRRHISAVPEGQWKYRQAVLLSCAIWAFPFFTGFLALGMEWYAPATGNWCWIEPKPVYLRYLLLHGWRFLFIIIEISLYIYLNIYLRRHYRALAAEGISPPGGIGSRFTRTEPRQESSSRVLVTTIDLGEKSTIKSTSEATASVYSPNTSQRSTTGLLPQDRPRSTFWARLTGLRGTSRTTSDFSADARYKAIQRALLLNAYPLAYIILWIPGIS
ncbi:hypothetical protein F5887DRAFT_1074757 [Amanita rubescens]|nr:hypothetical protein F5887DRAFT_1074757 [Amanita rubescens]